MTEINERKGRAFLARSAVHASIFHGPWVRYACIRIREMDYSSARMAIIRALPKHLGMQIIASCYRIVSPQPPRTLFPERGARQMPVQEHTNSIPRSCQHVRTRQEPLPNTTRKRSHVPPPSRRSSSSKPAGAFAHLPRSRDERTRLLVRLHHVHDRLLALAHMENTHVLRSSKWRLT